MQKEVGKINLKFWKKKDDLGEDEFKPLGGDPASPGPDMGGPENMGLGSPNMGLPDASRDPLGISGAGQPPVDPFASQDHSASPSQQGVPSEQPFGQQAAPSMRQSPGPQSSVPNNSRDFDLIVAKLDMIKSELDSINQRISRIERMNERAESTPEAPYPSKKYAREY